MTKLLCTPFLLMTLSIFADNGFCSNKEAQLTPILETEICREKEEPIIVRKKEDSSDPSEKNDSFNYKLHTLPEKIVYNNKKFNTYTSFEDENSFKILRNLPFAIRGFVFETKVIQDYYSSQSWYKPNPNYKANLGKLTIDEKLWLRAVKSN